MRLRCFPVGGENEFDEQTVLFDDPELMTVLADDMAVSRQFPCGIRLFHQMTAAAELRIFLNIRIISHSENDSDNAYDKQDRNKDDLVPGSQPAVQLFKEILKEFDHRGYASIRHDSEKIP